MVSDAYSAAAGSGGFASDCDCARSQRGPAGNSSAIELAKRLKTLGGLTPANSSAKYRQKGPDRFILDPIHQLPGPYNYRRHDNRRAFFSRLAMAGVDLRTVACLAGHATIQMAMRYAN
ncbi:MAG: tyrosine-type recombinase/integrase [Acidobacteriaceae bacterium]